MEKRSRRRIRDLVARPASLGLSENEIGCARISMMARNTNVPFKGRRKTYHLQIITFRLQRAAGPYRGARTGLMHCSKRSRSSRHYCWAMNVFPDGPIPVILTFLALTFGTVALSALAYALRELEDTC